MAHTPLHLPPRPVLAWPAILLLLLALLPAPASAQTGGRPPEAPPPEGRQVRTETIEVGRARLGVDGVDAQGDTVRIRVFLSNPTDEAVTLPLPAREVFALIGPDGGRVAAARVEAPAGSGAELTLAAHARVGLTLVFGGPVRGLRRGDLRVGTLGVIRGIRIRTGPEGGSDGVR